MHYVGVLLGVVLTLGVAGERAAQPIDAECRAKLTRQLTTLESGFAANHMHFDQELDRIITQYAALHPAASKEDYRAVFDAMFEERFSEWFTIHRNLLAGYRAVLDGAAELKGICDVPEEEMDQGNRRNIERNRSLYQEILQEMAQLLE